MTARRVRPVVLGCALLAVGCGPGTGETGTTGTTSTGSTGAVTSTGTTDSPTGGTTGTPTTDGTSGSGGASSSTGPAVECMDVPVTPGGRSTCEGQEFVLDDPCEQLAGYELCDDGSTHRHTAVPCNVTTVFPACERPDEFSTCAVDSDCVEFPGGTCNGYDDNTGNCSCRYLCGADDDCGGGGACMCSLAWQKGHSDVYLPFYSINACLPAQCRSDADCGGLHCGVSLHPCDYPEGLFCHTPEDECHGDDDCEGTTGRCAYLPAEMRWTCGSYANCE